MKRERELRRLAKQFGRRVERTSNGHFKLVCIRGERPFVIHSSSTSDSARARKNLLADLRRNDKPKGD